MQDDAHLTNPRTILEAMLFVGHPENESLTREQATAGMRGVEVDEIDALIAELNADYQQQGCPYHVVEEKDGFRMTLLPQWQPLRNRFYGKLREARLSQAAIDVLSVVAYRQPISREEVDELRGRESGALLRQLIRRKLLQLDIPQEKGATRTYRTTDRFLELFGLEKVDDLPQSEEVESTS